MTLTLLQDSAPRRLSFYLSLEEYLSSVYGEGFFLWETAPCVILGRNQDAAAEVNLDYCRSHQIEVYRRKSGGGCVYSGPGNLMISCIVPPAPVQESFTAYLQSLAATLASLGAEAVTTANNDILCGGRKVSGNAFFSTPRAGIIHGTLLYDMDFSPMQYALTPSGEKLRKHAVASVRQRVANLKELYPAMEETALKAALTQTFSSGSRVLTTEEMQRVEQIERSYLSPDFILGKVR
jgi:lipoic acid synthetase/lipoate-protein ligase A